MTRAHWGLVWVCLCSCVTQDNPYSVPKDLRVLAVRAEPPEVFVDDTAPGAHDVVFDALVVDPRGGPIEVAWRMCPIESADACFNFDDDVADEDTATQGLLTSIWTDVRTSEAVPLDEAVDPGASRRAVWPYAVDSFAFAPPLPLFLYHAEASGLGALQGAWPSAILAVRSQHEDDTLVVQKRLVLNVRDISAFAGEAAQVGITVCPPGAGPDEVPGCIPLSPREQNQNPVFDRILVARGDRADATFEELEEVPVLRPGAALRIRPVFTDASYQAFERVQVDLDSAQLEVIPDREEISVAWFVSHGSVQDELTWPKFTKTLDTVYFAPKEVPDTEAGHVSLWLVAQDQRGGTAWRSLEIAIRAP